MDQKFLSESNATARIKSQMIEFSNGLIIYDPQNAQGSLNNFINEYPALSNYFAKLESNSSDFVHDLSEDGSINLKEIIELADENASFAAQELRNDLAAALGKFLIKGLRLRSIDRKGTTAAQERAILEMEPTVISVQRVI